MIELSGDGTNIGGALDESVGAVASEQATRPLTGLNGHSKPIASTQTTEIMRARGWVPQGP